MTPFSFIFNGLRQVSISELNGYIIGECDKQSIKFSGEIYNNKDFNTDRNEHSYLQ